MYGKMEEIMIIKVDAMGDTCPIPVVKTRNAIKELGEAGQVEVLVDNEIAVQNLTKMAEQKKYGIQSEKLGEGRYKVLFTVGSPEGEAASKPESTVTSSVADIKENKNESLSDDCISCYPDKRGDTVVVISSATMGNGNDELGAILMKGFIYALTGQDELPAAILFYNGGAKLTCQDSPALEDLKAMEAQGVEILTCGTCLDFYGLKDSLQVGSVTNMYVIVEKMTQAQKVIRP
jgi:selenium metabolism protein YedF